MNIDFQYLTPFEQRLRRIEALAIQIQTGVGPEASKDEATAKLAAELSDLDFVQEIVQNHFKPPFKFVTTNKEPPSWFPETRIFTVGTQSQPCISCKTMVMPPQTICSRCRGETTA